MPLFSYYSNMNHFYIIFYIIQNIHSHIYNNFDHDDNIRGIPPPPTLLTNISANYAKIQNKKTFIIYLFFSFII